MARHFFRGIKPGVGPVVKVMRSDADNPLTTPNTDYGKFNFNSETSDLAIARDILTGTLVGSVQSGGVWNHTTYIDMSGLVAEFGFWPYVDVQVQYSAGYWGDQGWYKFETSSSDPYTVNYCWWSGNTAGFPNAPTSQCLSVEKEYFVFGDNTRLTALPNLSFKAMIWALPSDGNALPWSNGTPVVGQKVISIKGGASGHFKIARPGYDVDTATGNQHIISSTVRPAQCVAAGVVTLGAGATHAVILPSEAAGKSIYVDFQWNEVGQPRFVPYHRYGYSAAQILYTVSGSVLYLTNSFGGAKDVVFAAYAEDGLPPSSGGNHPTIRVVPDADPYLQIVRPGTVTPPRLADILLDTRWPVIFLVAHETIALSAASVRAGNLNISRAIPDLGYIPIVKFAFHARYNSNAPPFLAGTDYGFRSRFPRYAYHEDGSPQPECLVASVTRTSLNISYIHKAGTGPFRGTGTFAVNNDKVLSAGSLHETFGPTCYLTYYVFGIPI